jgi:hypothetical protein
MLVGDVIRLFATEHRVRRPVPTDKLAELTFQVVVEGVIWVTPCGPKPPCLGFEAK